MKVKSENGRTYIIQKAPSIFTSRNNASEKLNDVSVYESGHNHGVRFDGEDGLFITIAKFTENGSVIRHYTSLPSEINTDLLKQWGFME